MNKKGPLIIVEDDADDQYMFTSILSELQIKNELVILEDGLEAYEYLKEMVTDPFLIISDINLPKMTGIQLRDKMQEGGDLRMLTVPFIFFTTASATNSMLQAYANSIQGFFTKPSSYHQLKRTMQIIIEYWQECAEPKIYP